MNDFDGMKRKITERVISSLLSGLAMTKGESAFYLLFRIILVILFFSQKGHKHTRGALKNIIKAFKARTPTTQLARRLVQDLLGKTSRERLASFFVDWVMGVKKRERLEDEGFKAPWLFVISILKYCDLSCPGCYANADKGGTYLSYPLLNRITADAKRLGIAFLTISGGEPFIYHDRKEGKNIIDFFRANSKSYFQVYTNATSLIDRDLAERELGERARNGDEKAKAALERIRRAARKNERLYGVENIVPLLAELGNVASAISQEGFEAETDKRRGEGMYLVIENARKNLTAHGLLHGFSITYTRENTEVLIQEKLIDELIGQDVSFGWFFNYMPKGRDPDVNLMPAPKQRERLRDFVWEMRRRKPIFMGDFWNDGPWTGGCIAGGRKYFHIRADGKVTPCVFMDFTIGHIERDFYQKGKTLRDVILHPAFRYLRKRQLEIKNKLNPCCIIGEPSILRDVVRIFGLEPALPGEENILQGERAKFLDNYAMERRILNQDIWEDLKSGKLDTKNVKMSEVIRNAERRLKKEFELMK